MNHEPNRKVQNEHRSHAGGMARSAVVPASLSRSEQD